MIVEIFGPPAAGKTTFARGLTSRLNDSGRPAQLVLSYRPAEFSAPGASAAAVPLAGTRRVTRAALEYLALGATRSTLATSGLTASLLELLPPISPLWKIRLRQYLLRLEGTWCQARKSSSIVVIDQGFVQSICSLLLLGHPVGQGVVEQALALIPRPDHWIRVDASRAELHARLLARRRAQSWIERRMELDIDTSLRSIEVLDEMVPLLQRQGARVTRIGPDDSWSPEDPPAAQPKLPVAQRSLIGGARAP